MGSPMGLLVLEWLARLVFRWCVLYHLSVDMFILRSWRVPFWT